MSFRACRRAVALALTLALSVLRYWVIRARGPLTLEERALWLQSMARGVLHGLGIHSRVYGHPPTSGLVVANHLSYLDAAILSATMPCLFVAKLEIGRWPFFGKVSRVSGTIFIDRSSRASAAAAAREIGERLRLGHTVMLFPEGTSSDGAQVLPFYSSLFEPAVVTAAPVSAASIRYVFEDGRPERELCWFGNEAFLPHIWRALGAAGFFAEVTFGNPQVYPDRRSAARATHDEVAAMRAGPVVGDGAVATRVAISY